MAIGAVIVDPPRTRGTRAGLAVIAVLALAFAAAAWLAVTEDGFMPVTQVKVSGEFRNLRRADLHAAIAAHVTGGFFTVDVAAVRQAAERLPWIESASVRRVWPDTLVVSVIERRAVARWNDGALLDENGSVFRPESDNLPAGLPELIGPEGNAALVLARWRDLEAVLAPLRQHVQQLTQDERRAWTARLDNGVELALGRADVAERLRRYVVAYPLALAPRARELAAVDLRYTNGFAARWAAGLGAHVPQRSGTAASGERARQRGA